MRVGEVNLQSISEEKKELQSGALGDISSDALGNDNGSELPAVQHTQSG